MTSPQKAKGNSFEREVAGFLTKTYGETFIRAPGSGAYVGGTNQHRKQYLHEGQIRSFKGDIVPGQSFPKMNAECKNYADFPWHQLLQGSCKKLDGWIEQLLDVADEGDFNILFMKFNRKGKFIAVESRHQWDQTQNLPYFQYYYVDTKSKPQTTTSWLIFDFDKFMEKNAEQVRKLCA